MNMAKSSKNQSGFSAVMLLVIIVSIALIALAGYFVFMRQNNDEQKTSNQTSQVVVPEAPEIKTKADVTKAEQTLDSINLNDNSDLDAIDKELRDL